MSHISISKVVALLKICVPSSCCGGCDSSTASTSLSNLKHSQNCRQYVEMVIGFHFNTCVLTIDNFIFRTDQCIKKVKRWH